MTNENIDWNSESIVNLRNTYYAASQRAFVPYKAPLIFKSGKGQYLWDEKGNKYTDLLGMNVCISVGHCHSKVNKAVQEQLNQLVHCTTMFYHPVPAHYAEELTKTMPDGEDWVVHFTNSGTEAIDLALLMARVYTKNNDILALRNSYHGASYGAQSLTGVGNFRHNTPLLGGIVHVAQPDGFRGIFGENMPAYLDEIDRNIHYATSKQLAGMIVEPIQGYGGIVPLLPGYIKGAYERVHAAGGIFIVDEVQSGFCRTGDNYWGFESEDIIPDIVVVAKGMGNGYPLGAVIAKRQIAEVLKDKFYFNTYGANPTSCAAGRAVLQVLKEEKLQENARRVGAALKKRLLELQGKYPIIGDVRGKGLMLSLELVKDRQTKEPAVEEAANIIEMTRHQGLVISKSGGYKNCLRLMPPLCLSIEDIDYIISALDNCFSSNQLT